MVRREGRKSRDAAHAKRRTKKGRTTETARGSEGHSTARHSTAPPGGEVGGLQAAAVAGAARREPGPSSPTEPACVSRGNSEAGKAGSCGAGPSAGWRGGALAARLYRWVPSRFACHSSVLTPAPAPTSAPALATLPCPAMDAQPQNSCCSAAAVRLLCFGGAA